MEFIYLDEVSLKYPEVALDLFELADKYNMPKLEGLCGEFFLNRITLRNVVRISKLAEQSGLEGLKENVVKFIQKNPNGFLKRFTERT